MSSGVLSASATPRRLAKALDKMFILHAEHELNCSTSAVRHLASSGVDVYSATAGAVAALYGPLHGGANEAVLRMLGRIGSVENIPSFLERVKAKKAREHPQWRPLSRTPLSPCSFPDSRPRSLVAPPLWCERHVPDVS